MDGRLHSLGRVLAQATNVVAADHDDANLRNRVPRGIDLGGWGSAVYGVGPIEQLIDFVTADGLA